MSFVPLTDVERRAMLAALGLPSAERLFDAIPSSVRFPEIDIGPALTELQITDRVESLAGRNLAAAASTPFFLGAGAYKHFIPSAVSAIMSRSEFSTSYTPYQPEVSQGTLQVTFEFQSMVCDLTAMDVSNASVYDGATALAEAVLMALRITGRRRVILSGSVHPRYRDVLQTYLGSRDVEIVTTAVRLDGGRLVEEEIAGALDAQTACCVVSQPTFFGEIHDLSAIVDATHAAGALLIEVYNPTSLGLLKPPGAWGADIAVAEGQALGIPLSYGGPYVGLMSCRKELVRQLPGRIVGATTDAEGRRGFVLTLQAREQHIRREKATSNICTSETLIALGLTCYLALMGPGGLREVAEACCRSSRAIADGVSTFSGVEVVTSRPFFHEVAVRLPISAAELNRGLLDRGIVGGFDVGRAYPELANVVLLCGSELTTDAHVDRLVDAMREICDGRASVTAPASVARGAS